MRGYTVSRGKQPETATAILFAPSRSQASEVTDFKTRQVYKEFWDLGKLGAPLTLIIGN